MSEQLWASRPGLAAQQARGFISEHRTIEMLKIATRTIAPKFQRTHECLVLRSYEKASCDAYLCIIDIVKARRDRPRYKGNDHSILSWLSEKKTLPVGVMVVPLEMKYQSLSCRANQPGMYCWSAAGSSRGSKSSQSSIVFLDTGISDAVALLPPAVFFYRRSSSLRSVDTVKLSAPVWAAPFVITTSRLPYAIGQIITSCINPGQQAHYTNPSTKTQLDHWIARPNKQPSFLPPQSDRGLGFKADVELWKELRKLGFEIDFNPFQPWLYDFRMWISTKRKPLRIEAKCYQSFSMFYRNHEKDQKNQKRKRNGKETCLNRNNFWHVLWIILPEERRYGLVMRDQLAKWWQRDGTLHSLKYAKKHNLVTFFDYTDINGCIEHIRRYEKDARKAVRKDLARLRPKKGRPLKDEPREVIKISGHKDLLALRQPKVQGHGRMVNGLPWLLSQWNHASRYGTRESVLLPLSRNNIFATHVLIKYQWTEDDISRYDRDGTLPLPLWCDGDLDCVLIRSMDIAWSHKLTTASWRDPALKDCDIVKGIEEQHCLLLGCPTSSAPEYTKKYMLYPSCQTLLTQDYDCYERIKPETMAEGQSFWTGVNVRAESKAFPKKISENHFKSWLVEGAPDPMRFLFNLRDGSLLKQAERLFTDSEHVDFGKDDKVTIEPEHYLIKYKDVLQIGWIYGCRKS